jgi:hypothetical protein
MATTTPDSSWEKSSFSGSQGCVEWCIDGEGVSVRDTKDRDGAQLRFTYIEWAAFLAAVRNGEADLTAASDAGLSLAAPNFVP